MKTIQLKGVVALLALAAGTTLALAAEPTLKVGDRIVVLDEEFPSNVLPWRRIALETGAVVATVPTPADGDWTSLAELAKVPASDALLIDRPLRVTREGFEVM